MNKIKRERLEKYKTQEKYKSETSQSEKKSFELSFLRAVHVQLYDKL